jgi:hypothetical protein
MREQATDMRADLDRVDVATGSACPGFSCDGGQGIASVYEVTAAFPRVAGLALWCTTRDEGGVRIVIASYWRYGGAGTLCGIWANSKSFLLARSRRADRVGQPAAQRTASTGDSDLI